MPETTITDVERERALAALAEITAPATVGDFTQRIDNEDGSYTLVFSCRLAGYPGWHWNVAMVAVDGDLPTVIEAELLPAEGALVAPDWVPWSQRLAEYLEAQKQAGIDEEAALAQMQAEALGDDDDLDDFDDEESDDSDDPHDELDDALDDDDDLDDDLDDDEHDDELDDDVEDDVEDERDDLD